MIGSFQVSTGQRWLDLRTIETREQIRRILADTLVNLSRTDFDMGDALSRNRALTQAIAGWAYKDGYQGVIYKSRFNAAFDCWALFEGARFEVLEASSITRDDEDLLAVAQVFRLRRAV